MHKTVQQIPGEGFSEPADRGLYVPTRGFVELEQLNARRDNLEIEWGQLQLEQSAWSTQAFVERVATTKLHMAMPPPKEIEIVAP